MSVLATMEKGVCPGRRLSRCDGFSLIELIVVIVIVGVLSVVAVPRMLSRDGLAARGHYDELAQALRYAQKRALASGCSTRVAVTGNGFAVQRTAGADCSGGWTDEAHPSRRADAFSASWSGSSISSPSTVVFAPSGAPDSGRSFTISGGDFAATLTVHADTGYVQSAF